LSDLIELTIAEAADRRDRREVSCVDLVRATLDRIEATEADRHAYATVLADSALARAHELDAELARGERRSDLHGIPVAVKDVCFTKDILTEGGSRAYAGFVPDYDATVVRRLDEAGAILVGKATTHEFAWGVNDAAAVSPWREDCYPGGSSTGSGVAVAVRSAFAAIGTDTGGSIRIPASINGIVGMKPTLGRVSCHGVMKVAPSLDHVGPMTRTPEDCAIVLRAIAGHDPLDSITINESVPDYRAGIDTGVEGLVIGVEREHYFYGAVADDVRHQVDTVLDHLAAAGARVVEVQFPEFALMTTVLLTILFPESSSYHRQLIRERRDDYDPSTRVLAAMGDFVPGSHYVTALRARTVLRDRMRDLFERHGLDAMVWPTMPQTTVPKSILNEIDDHGDTPMNRYVHHTFTANVLGMPALSAPCGISEDGLAIGYDILGRPFEETTILRIAHAYERDHSWHAVRPPLAP
jgi:aspartyl-tRNA(Asn)/glutamyl-tRNA(Gln) amidotransferase subunit A